MLFESVSNIEGDHKKERLRVVIRDIFDLDSKDMVIFRQNDIFIKRWGGAPLIHPQLIEKIKEAISQESEQSDSVTIVNDCITISTEGLFEEFGIRANNISAESKEKIRQRLKEQISISSKDIVLFLNDKVVIRRFKQSSEEERIKSEQRYNGLPKEELMLLKNSIFESVEAEQEIIAEITEQILQYELDFSRITHGYFLKNYIKIFQKQIFEFLRDNLSEEEMVLEGLANLLLRENWILVHTKMALAILTLVGQKNPNAENFLKNYSGDIEVDNDRNKFKLPEILDKTGTKWNVPSIIGIVMQRQKILDAVSAKRKGIDDIGASIEEMYSKMDELNEEMVHIEKEFNAIDCESGDRVGIETAINAEIKELREMLKRCREEDRKKIQAEISDKTLYIKKLVIKEDSLFTRKKRLEHQSKLISARIEKMNFDIIKLQKRHKEEEDKIVQFVSSQKGIDEKFDSLSEALTMALMKRKTKI
jgi:hypothetical protein